jgi:hypothetical protein
MKGSYERPVGHRAAGSGTLPMVGYRRLAIRVIELAFRDLDCASPDLRRSARAFLAGHPLLFLWCDLAEIRPARVMERAGEAAPRQDPGASAPAVIQTSAGALTKLAMARSSVS